MYRIRHQTGHRWLSAGVVALSAGILALSGLIGGATAALAQDAGAEIQGQALYQGKGECRKCHGWRGDGNGLKHFYGANLRETTLDREGLAEAVSCGRPGTIMPFHDALAYGEHACYGMFNADLAAADLKIDQAAGTLQPHEIDAIIDFLFARVIGKGPTPTMEDCVFYWGAPTTTMCRFLEFELRQAGGGA